MLKIIKKLIKLAYLSLSQCIYKIIFTLFRSKISVYELQRWYDVLPIPSHKTNVQKFIWLFKNLKEYRSLLYFRMNLPAWHPIRKLFPPQPLCFLGNRDNVGIGLVLQHGYSTVINCESIGTNCQIWQNVTIGVSKSGGGKPRIGNNVKICCNSVVLGDIVIGNDVTIGASSVVVKSIPSGCTVVGNPAKIIHNHD